MRKNNSNHTKEKLTPAEEVVKYKNDIRNSDMSPDEEESCMFHLESDWLTVWHVTTSTKNYILKILNKYEKE